MNSEGARGSDVIMTKITLFNRTTSGNFQIHTNRLKIEYLPPESGLKSKLVMTISTTETIKPEMVGNTFFLSFRTDSPQIVDEIIEALRTLKKKMQEDMLPKELML